jgi:hypothetical protein
MLLPKLGGFWLLPPRDSSPSQESHPMDHDSNSSGHTIHASLPPGPLPALCYDLLSNSYVIHPSVMSIIAPVKRTSIAPQPLPYFSSVNDRCARIHQGSRNHAFGDTSINNAFTNDNTKTQKGSTQTQMMSILSTRNSSERNYVKPSRNKLPLYNQGFGP